MKKLYRRRVPLKQVFPSTEKTKKALMKGKPVPADEKARLRSSDKALKNRPGDKDEFRLRDVGAKGMPVRISSVDPKKDPLRVRQEERDNDRWSSDKWFQDGFDDPSKRVT